MKKFKTMMAMMLALVSMCVAFSSCSSDDDYNNGAGSSATAEQVVGTYVGETMSIALAGQGDMDPLENATFKLEKVDRKSTRLNSSHQLISRMPSSA